MSQIKCTQCGTMLQGGERFCPTCGAAVLETPAAANPVSAADTETGVTQMISEDSVNGRASGQSEGGKKGRKLTVSSVILSIIFSLLLIVLGTAASAIFILKQGMGRAAIESAVSNVEFAELKVGAFSGSGQNDQTLPELIYDSIDPQFKAYMPEEKEAVAAIEDFLEEDFIQDFVAEKTNDYVSDMLTGSGDGEIKVKEVMTFLKHHQEELEELVPFEYHFTSNDFDDVESFLKETKVLDDYKLSKLRKGNSTAFDMIRWICSNWMLGICLGVCAVLMIIMFFINRKFRRTMLYLGISVLLIGILDCVAGAMFGSFSEIMNDRLDLGKGFYNALLAPARMWSFITGSCMIVVGMLAAILPQLLRKK